MKLKKLAVIAVMLVCAPPGTAGGETIVTDHFTVDYETGGKLYAGIASRAAEQAFERISRSLGHRPEGRITIMLAGSAERFGELTGDALPDWSTAVALPGRRIVISPLEGSKLALEHILAHEIVHIIIRDAAGETFVPRWFHEGCAEIYSGQWGIRSRLYLAWHVVRGNLLTFEDIQRVFSRGSMDAGMAYDQSMVAVNRLMALSGPKTPALILDGLERGLDFQEAFFNAAGMYPGEFEPLYIAHMKRTYGRRSLVTLIPGTWTGIMLLAFLAYIIKKYRTRRLLREWEEAERRDNIVDFKRRYPPDAD